MVNSKFLFALSLISVLAKAVPIPQEEVVIEEDPDIIHIEVVEPQTIELPIEIPNVENENVEPVDPTEFLDEAEIVELEAIEPEVIELPIEVPKFEDLEPEVEDNDNFENVIDFEEVTGFGLEEPSEIVEIEAVEPEVVDLPVDIPVFEPEVAEPVDIGTDANSVISNNVDNFVNVILGNISFAIKNVLEEELGVEQNDDNANPIINDVIVNVLSQTGDEITNAVNSVLGNGVDDETEVAAEETANKVAEVLKDKVAAAIASVENVDAESATQKILEKVTEIVKDYIHKNIEVSKIVVEETLTNESSEDIAVANINDIATMVTNSVGHIIKSNLCINLDDGLTTICENLANSIVEAISPALNEIVANQISTTEEKALAIGCALIPPEIFAGKLVEIVNEVIANQLQTENPAKTGIPVLALVVNLVENILCVDRTSDVNDEGHVVLRDVSTIANHIIEKVNYINEDIAANIDNVLEDQVGIASGIVLIQATLKDTIVVNELN